MVKQHYERIADQLKFGLSYARDYARQEKKAHGLTTTEALVKYCNAQIVQALDLGAEEQLQFRIWNTTAFLYIALREAIEADCPPEMKFCYDRVLRVLMPYLNWYAGLTGKDAIEGDTRTNIIQTYHIATFELAGRNVFQVSQGLTDLLQHTELRGLMTDDLRLPHESIYIQVPAELGFQVINESTGWHPVEGVYVVEDPVCPIDSPIIPLREGAATTRGWRIMIVGASKNPADENDDAVIYYTLRLPPNELLDDALRTQQEETSQYSDLARQMLAEENRIFRFALNAILYATWPDAEQEHVIPNKEARQLWERIQKVPKGSKKRERLNQQLKSMHATPVTRLGHSIVVDRSTSVSDGSDGAPGRKLFIRTRVKGHWRRYHVGSGRTEITRKWVRPFWRGQDGSLEIEPTHYVLKRSDSTKGA